jgi:hypothetical protein
VSPSKLSLSLTLLGGLLVSPVWSQEPEEGLGHGPEVDGSAEQLRATPRWQTDPGALPPAVARRAREVRDLPLPERVGAISELFLGLPYLDGCTGEGEGFDQDPPARYDVFDCVTFIEEVLALSLAADPAWAGWYRTQLRFEEGVPSYEARNHFFVMEWIRYNIEAGFIEDVTPQLGEVRWIEREISDDTWSAWRRRGRFPLADERLPTGTMRLPVLPLPQALEAVDRIPPGAIIVTVRIPLDHVPIVVTHVGLTVPAAEPTMRHATKMGDGRVRDDRLAWYLEHLESYSNWPVAGITVLMPREQGPRVTSAPRAWAPEGTKGPPADAGGPGTASAGDEPEPKP